MVRDLGSRAGASLGVYSGVLKGDIVLDGGELYVIEIAPWPSGDYFCTREIPLNTGVDSVGQAIRLSLGEKITLEEVRPRHQHHVAQHYLLPPRGEVVAVRGADEVASWEGVQPVDVLGRTSSHSDRVGVVILTGDERKAAVEHIRVVAWTGG